MNQEQEKDLNPYARLHPGRYLRKLAAAGLVLALVIGVPAATNSPTVPSHPPPTLANMPYGKDPAQVLDFWRAPSPHPSPLVLYIHGGGWAAGDKSEPYRKPTVEIDVGRFLANGISVASINYRFVTAAMLAGRKCPVEWPMHDAARALQFLRYHSRELNLDKARIAVAGGSAGACTSLWLALHDNLADPLNPDLIARESTRVYCAAVLNAQTTLDPKQMLQWTPNSVYGGHAFGFMRDPNDVRTRDAEFPQFLANREKILREIIEYSPLAHVSADDPPIYLKYLSAPALGKDQADPTHTANFGVPLAERLREVGVPCELVFPGASGIKHKNAQDFLLDQLK